MNTGRFEFLWNYSIIIAFDTKQRTSIIIKVHVYLANPDWNKSLGTGLTPRNETEFPISANTMLMSSLWPCFQSIYLPSLSMISTTLLWTWDTSFREIFFRDRTNRSVPSTMSSSFGRAYIMAEPDWFAGNVIFMGENSQSL